MSATLKLTHKTIGVEVRRGTYNAMVDGERAGSVELNETIDIPVEPGGTPCKSATAGTPAEPRRSTPPRVRSSPSYAAERESCRSFSCPSSFPAWHSRSIASSPPCASPPPRSEPGPHPSRPEREPEEGELRALVKAASLAILAVHDPVCPRTPTCSIRFRSASSTASGMGLESVSWAVKPGNGS